MRPYLCGAAFALMACAGPLSAVPLEIVLPGQSFYLQQLGSNEVVTVIAVDRASGWIEIRRSDGTTDWVVADDLLTSSESTTSEFQEGAAWLAITGALACALIEDCRNAMSGQE